MCESVNRQLLCGVGDLFRAFSDHYLILLRDILEGT